MLRIAVISTALAMTGCSVETSSPKSKYVEIGVEKNGCLGITESDWKTIPWLRNDTGRVKRKRKDEFDVNGVRVEAKRKKTRKRIMQRNGKMYVLADEGSAVGFRDQNGNSMFVKVNQDTALYWDGENLECKAA
ncbi:hypothetical protein ACJ3XI_07715 [Litorimonas sp. RW-G-Af-16]|uniref:hypothetical protein n=1 Tax=Litorimonas sp. RW-G-Af-16 TaxID=3241168 RepID=UPI00390CB72F